jgi:endonuclease/exonuclease/phosphatase family metal-dependent hydrolase
MKNRIHIAAGCKKSVAAARVALAITVGVVCAVAIDAGVLAPAVQAQGSSGTAPRISVGTWNTMLQPWFPYEPDVITTIASTKFDALALQEVWTEAAKDRIVSHLDVKAAYPYYYYAPALQEVGLAPIFVPDQFVTDYTDCLEANGIDTRQVDQPTLPIPFGCQQLALNLAFTDPGSLECINSTMEQLSPGGNPADALYRCAFGNGVRYSHGGRSGLLILSKSPIENLELIPYDTFLIHRAVIYATIGTTRYAFTQFPKNYLEDMDGLLGPFQYGALQPQLAQDVIGRDPDVIAGDFNSSPDYQPAAHNLFVENGYRPLFSNVTTFCPASTHSSFQPCQPPTGPIAVPGPRLLDNIYVRDSAALYRTGVFAERPASDHIGLVAVSTTAPPVITLKPALSLFPPNHNYVSVNISQMVLSAVDDYDGNLLHNVVIEKVTSDEPDNASGNADGNTVDDIVIGRDSRSVQLRSERDETKNGRVYVVTLRLEDSSGNTVRAEYKVTIPIGQIGQPAIQGAVAYAVSSDCC